MAAKKRTLKVFCDKAEQADLAKDHEIVERYDSFVLVLAGAREATRLKKKYVVEDITSLYEIRAGDRKIDTSRPRIDTEGKQHAHIAYRGAKRLSRGKHHYLVQFIGPIKPAWLRRLKKLGAEPRTSHSQFAYVVRCDEKRLQEVSALPCVRWVGHLRHGDRIHFKSGKGLEGYLRQFPAE